MTAEDTLIQRLKGAVISDVVKSSGIPKRTIYNYQNGVPIPLARAEKIAQALGLELYIGPAREAKSGKTGGGFSTFEAGPGLGPARDRIATMDIAKIFREQLARTGRKAANVSREATGNKHALKQILDGHRPSIDRAEKIARTLGLEFYIGPPRDAAGDAGPRLEPVRDRQLAEVLAIIVEHYEQNNEYGRRNFIEEVKARWPWLFRAGG